MADDDEDIDDGELTPSERRRLRKMLLADDRASWLRRSAKSWLIAIAAVVGAVVTIQTGLSTVVAFLKTTMVSR